MKKEGNKQMYNILIVEDVVEQAKSLKAVIEQKYDNCSVTIANTYEQAKALITSIEYIFHIFFFDIDLGSSEGDGLSLAALAREDIDNTTSPMIFLTSIQDKALKAVNEVHCLNYLLKPYTPEMVYDIMDYIFKAKLISEPKTIRFRDPDNLLFRFPIADFLYAKGSRHILNLCFTNGTFITNEYTLTNIMEDLPAFFTRNHKSYVLNVNHVVCYDKLSRFVSLSDGQKVPIGKSYKQDFEELFMRD